MQVTILKASTAQALEDQINKHAADTNRQAWPVNYQVTPITEYRSGQPYKTTVEYSAMIVHLDNEKCERR